MANTFKSVTSGSIGTTLTGVYTCPSSTTSIVLGASMANTHSSPIGGSIKLKKDGNDIDIHINNILRNGLIEISNWLWIKIPTVNIGIEYLQKEKNNLFMK